MSLLNPDNKLVSEVLKTLGSDLPAALNDLQDPKVLAFAAAELPELAKELSGGATSDIFRIKEMELLRLVRERIGAITQRQRADSGKRPEANIPRFEPGAVIGQNSAESSAAGGGPIVSEHPLVKEDGMAPMKLAPDFADKMRSDLDQGDELTEQYKNQLKNALKYALRPQLKLAPAPKPSYTPRLKPAGY